MAGTNQFSAFAAGVGANALTPSAWSALTALIAQGFTAGVASSEQFNTLMRQVSTAAAGTAQFAVNQSGGDALDNGSPASFAALLLAAIQATIDARIAASAVPAGMMMPFAMSTPPAGWLEADGSSQLRAAYPVLFARIGTQYGAADINHFNLPDARGVVLRGWDHGRGLDPSRGFGTYQADALQSFTGAFALDDASISFLAGAFTAGTAVGVGFDNGGPGTTVNFNPANGGAATAAETRVKSLAILICIKT